MIITWREMTVGARFVGKDTRRWEVAALTATEVDLFCISEQRPHVIAPRPDSKVRIEIDGLTTGQALANLTATGIGWEIVK